MIHVTKVEKETIIELLNRMEDCSLWQIVEKINPSTMEQERIARNVFLYASVKHMNHVLYLIFKNMDSIHYQEIYSKNDIAYFKNEVEIQLFEKIIDELSMFDLKELMQDIRLDLDNTVSLKDVQNKKYLQIIGKTMYHAICDATENENVRKELKKQIFELNMK